MTDGMDRLGLRVSQSDEPGGYLRGASRAYTELRGDVDN